MKNIFLMFVMTFSFAGYAFGECGDADKKGLEAFDRAWGMAGEKGDRNALMAIYADDYAGLPENQNKMQTIEDTMAAFERDRTNPNMADKVTHDNYMITCTPASAVITHRNIVTVKNGAGGKGGNLLDTERSFSRKTRRQMASRRQRRKRFGRICDAWLYGNGLEQCRRETRYELV